MAGFLQHSPARIIAELLIGGGHGTDPERSPNGIWPIYTGNAPDRPDEIIKVTLTAGMDDGYTNPNKERQEKPGIQILIRSVTEEEGYYKAQTIAIFLDQVQRTLVNIAELEDVGTGTMTYILHSIMRTTNVIAIGSDVPAGKRQLFTINAIVTLRECC